MSLLIAEGLDEMTFKGPFQPKLFYDSMILVKYFEQNFAFFTSGRSLESFGQNEDFSEVPSFRKQRGYN